MKIGVFHTSPTTVSSPTPLSQAPALYLLGEKELVNQEKMTHHSARRGASVRVFGAANVLPTWSAQV